MVTFLIGVSLTFNAFFIGLWLYGLHIDKKIKREAKGLINNTHKMSSDMFKNWMFEA